MPHAIGRVGIVLSGLARRSIRAIIILFPATSNFHVHGGDLMEKGMRWLRISYWTGAVIDGLAALQLLIPSLFTAINQISDFHATLAYEYAAGIAASLMLGWTCLLLWANRKPLERKGVLVITVCPVILGLVFTELWAVWSGFIVSSALLPTWVLQAALIGLFAYSYLHAPVSKPARRPR